MEQSCPSVLLVVIIAVTTGVHVAVGGNVGAIDDATGNSSNWNEISYLYNKTRLPGNVIPIKYLIYLHPNITDGKFQYTGNVKILLKVKEETDSIILHSLRLTHMYTQVFEVDESTNKITEEDYEKEIVVERTVKHKKHEQAIVQLGSKLSTGKRYVLDIMFSAKLRKELRGFYRTSYKTRKGEVRYVATTFFAPTGARLAFPCFDEPAMKAKFSIVMVRESIHTTLSNMPIEKGVLRNDGLVADYFQESVKMSTYLLAFVVSEFESLGTTSTQGIQVKVWAPKDQISQTRYAAEITPKILNYYEKFFKINYPLPKLDLIGIPDMGPGAMENWGLITFRLKLLLYDETESSSEAKQEVALVIAHELAHQWFGNLVTMRWWNDVWLNEGFASYVMYVGANLVAPDWKTLEQFVTASVQPSLSLDSHVKSHPISVPVEDPADIGALFDTITYKKGASVIMMMRDFIGHNYFAKGLANYLKTYRYGNADSDALWACLSKEVRHGNVNVKQVMDTWTLQMGYPVINIRRYGDTAYLTQERFVNDAKDKNTSNVSNSRWHIPLTFYYQHDQEKRRIWFNKSDVNVQLSYNKSLGWLKLNVGEVGFYRVNYDEMNWNALALQLKKDHKVLSAADRANLIDDAFQLALVGKISQISALELTEYLKIETEFVPFNSAVTSLSYVGDILLLRPGYSWYEKYVLQQILPLAKKLGWDDEGTHLNKLLRGIVLQLAVRHNATEDVKKAKAMFNDWMVNNKSIPTNLRKPVYYAGIKYGAHEEWNYVYNLYKASKYPTEKALLMYSLTHTSDPKLLRKYLRKTLDDDVIRSQDSCNVINKIALNPIGKKMAYKFVKENWSILIKRYGRGIGFRGLEQLFIAVFGTGKTKRDLVNAEKFFAGHKLGGGKLAAEQAVANIRNHIQWLKNNEKVVVEWLKTKVG